MHRHPPIGRGKVAAGDTAIAACVAIGQPSCNLVVPRNWLLENVQTFLEVNVCPQDANFAKAPLHRLPHTAHCLVCQLLGLANVGALEGALQIN